ncbi:uncharacterized protein LOC103009349 isoform X2 [Balaenoptera acutorostrata]|uniref:Uncharacterized protein LOC103009349 isoform X2 n=1 Tax=Balaenoptera acutorostrata TaxID=9767 RepID=A0ABM3S8N2_BALAC|nr:uncharacterized protein LOC103009349 isoform X2 [Balaenoptera acutorostrata]
MARPRLQQRLSGSRDPEPAAAVDSPAGGAPRENAKEKPLAKEELKVDSIQAEPAGPSSPGQTEQRGRGQRTSRHPAPHRPAGDQTQALPADPCPREALPDGQDRNTKEGHRPARGTRGPAGDWRVSHRKSSDLSTSPLRLPIASDLHFLSMGLGVQGSRC